MRVSYFHDVAMPSRFAAPIQILNTARELAALGVPTTVYGGPLRGDVDSCLAFYGLRPHPNLTIRPLFSTLPRRIDLPWRLRRARAQVNGPGPDVFLARNETAVALYPLLQRRRRRNARFVYEAHRLCFAHLAEHLTGRRWHQEDSLGWGVRRLREREDAVVNGADAIVCLTEGVKQALASVFRPGRPIFVLPSGVSLPARDGRAPAPGADERDVDVLYAGKLERRKGVPQLLAAMRELPGRRLWILGGAPDEITRCRAAACGLGVLDRVELVGFVQHSRLADYLARARVGVCPLSAENSITSERFTSPLKLLEFMAHGVPVVASDLPSIRTVVTHGKSAILVPPDDPAALAGGIRTLLGNPELPGRLAAAARRRAAEFSWPTRARRLLGFFEGLLSRDVPMSTNGSVG